MGEPKQFKLKRTLPFHLETRLSHRFQFDVRRDLDNGALVAIRRMSPATHTITPPHSTVRYGSDGTLLFPEKMTDGQKFELETRCDRIVDYFDDPYNKVIAVRQRLHNMAQGLTPVKGQFVIDWMNEHFPESLCEEVYPKKKAT